MIKKGYSFDYLDNSDIEMVDQKPSILNITTSEIELGVK